MRAGPAAAILVIVIVLLVIATPARAHRLDEYLQATTLAVANDHVAVQIHLTPGVAVFDRVLADMDTNGDGALSEAEQRAYAGCVLHDLSLTMGGGAAPLRLSSFSFPTVEEMRHGLGDIQLKFEADVPVGGSHWKLAFENHHQRGISVYLVNCLVPRDPDIRITDQNRNYNQSFYQVEYSRTGVGSNSQPAEQETDARGSLNQTGRRSLFRSFAYQGVHHILTGYDHLLFVGALVLAATKLWDVVKVVFIFTLAHSITLTLAALNVIHLSARLIEPMIAASIVFIAIQNVFWPKRARGWARLGAAFFFGLFHGLGFAGGLLEAMRQMPGATMLLAIVAFSVGVEAGHQMVVLPLFALLKTARGTQPDAVTRTRVATALQRIGSTGISIAGLYYLCLAFSSSGYP